MTFNELGISEELTKNLEKQNIKTPTRIQRATIPLILNKKNIFAQSQTGSGKTLAYLLPTIQQLKPKENLGLLIIAPTKELAFQINDNVKKIIKGTDLRTATFCGGKPRKSDQDILNRKNQIIVGTPGRILEYMKFNLIKLSFLKFIVIDETDNLLEMGFVDFIHQILKKCPKYCQKLMFSATQNKEQLELIKTYLKEYEEVKIKQNIISPKLKQQYIIINKENKKQILIDTLKKNKDKNVIIFCNKKSVAIYMSKFLNLNRFKTKVMHGKLESKERRDLYLEFRDEKIKILVATNLASRGLHSDIIDLIINYDLPERIKDYIHRIGRTARTGKSGTVISFIEEEQLNCIPDIEKTTKAKVKEIKIYSSSAVS
jgi:superfamily II DNA/RNA helicase